MLYLLKDWDKVGGKRLENANPFQYIDKFRPVSVEGFATFCQLFPPTVLPTAEALAEVTDYKEP